MNMRPSSVDVCACVNKIAKVIPDPDGRHGFVTLGIKKSYTIVDGSDEVGRRNLGRIRSVLKEVSGQSSVLYESYRTASFAVLPARLFVERRCEALRNLF